jgi:20S proteasome subunit alpha 7
MSEIEKLDLPNISLDQGVKHAARIILIARGDCSAKDLFFKLEMSWVRLGPDSKTGVHEYIPKEIVEAAEKQAIKELEDGDQDKEED